MNKLSICSFYNVEPLLKSFKIFTPNHIIIICEDEKNPKLEKNLDDLQILKSVVTIEIKKIKHYDIYEVAKETVRILEENSPKFDEINVNVTGGRKTAALGLIYGSYARKELIDKIVYITEENSDVIELPKMSYNVGKSKLAILEHISKCGKPNIPKLTNKMDKTRGLIYLHIKDLINDGFLNANMELTTAGKIALL